MTPNWLQQYIEDERLTAKRVSVAWEGKHVALVKKTRPVRWTILDKEYDAHLSPAKGEVFEAGRPLLETDLRTGRLSRPDLDRLVERTKELDEKYPKLVAAREAKQAAYTKRIEAEKQRARQRASAAKKRANVFAKALKAAGVTYSRSDMDYHDAFKLARFQIDLKNGIWLDVHSSLDGFQFAQVHLTENNQRVATPETAAKIVAAISRLRIPKER
jgi:hypothetical protein